jgi:hypothetical protein
VAILRMARLNVTRPYPFIP